MSDERARRRAATRPTVTRHGRLATPGPVGTTLRFIAASLAVVLVSGVSVGAYAVWSLADNVETVDLVAQDGAEPPAPPGLGRYEGGFDMLIAASDQCDGNICESDRTEVLNDFTMLLHVAEDQKSAVAVSFPRDLIVSIPSCPREEEQGGGSYPSISYAQINVSLTYGGLPCTVETVHQLTGLDIPYAGLMKFGGVVEMSTALGGVPVCIDGPISDPLSGLEIPAAGVWELEGEQARQFLRSRYGVGDGSDLGRISSQQLFLSSLVRKVKEEDTLTDIAKLYGLAQAATSNMTLSSNLPATTMVSMAMVLKDIPLENITFVQYPTFDSGDRVVPNEAQAEVLIEKIRADESFLVETTGVGSEVLPTPSDPAVPADPEAPDDPAVPDPAVPQPEVLTGVTGQTAADGTCTKANN